MAGSEGGSPSIEKRQVRLRRRVVRDRKGELRLFAVLLALVFLGFIVVLRYLVTMTAPPLADSDAAQTEDLYFTLRMDARDYARGQPIGLQLSVRNTSGHPVSMSFDTDQEFDFVVQRELNLLFVRIPLEVWRYSGNKVARKQPHSLTIMPGEEKIFRAKWNQVDGSGRQVKPGRYVISGYVNNLGERHALQIQTSR